MRRSNNSAFSMIEVAVAIAIIAILAGAVAPLALKALNQQREQKTRDNLKIAYESLFGSRDRRVSNMRADFGYNPQVGSADLRFMTTRTSGVPTPLPYAPAPAGFSWGWNGPYWTGSTQPQAGVAGGLPADGWGRAIRLVLSGGAWQVQSSGANGTFGNADDLVFPPTTILLSQAQMSSTLVVNVFNKTALPLTQITLNIQSRAQGPSLPGVFSCIADSGPPVANTPLGGNPLSAPLDVNGTYVFTSSWIPSQLPGPLMISVSAAPAGTAGPLVLDLLPGEPRTIDFYIH